MKKIALYLISILFLFLLGCTADNKDLSKDDAFTTENNNDTIADDNNIENDSINIYDTWIIDEAETTKQNDISYQQKFIKYEDELNYSENVSFVFFGRDGKATVSLYDIGGEGTYVFDGKRGSIEYINEDANNMSVIVYFNIQEIDGKTYLALQNDFLEGYTLYFLQGPVPTGKGENTQNTPEQVMVQLDAYFDILDMYYDSILSNWDNCDGVGKDDVGDPDNACYLFYRFHRYSSAEEIGYSMIDINNDDQYELFIALLDDAKEGTFYDMYTILNGEAIHVISGRERAHYTLADNYSINCVGSARASHLSTCNYRLDALSGTLKINQEIIYDSDIDFIDPYFYVTEDYFDEETFEIDYSKWEPISMEESINLRNSMPDNLQLALIPFSEYHS